MGRSYNINGETLVLVKGTGALANALGEPLVSELGLASEQIVITPTFYRKDIVPDDFGPSAPAEVLFNLATVTIKMTLIQYDELVLEACIQNSMAGGVPNVNDPGFYLDEEGWLTGAGTAMGAGLPLYSPGNFFIGLYLLSPVQDNPWRFPSAYLSEQPVEIPLGTKTSAVVLTWTAIPYAPIYALQESLSTSGAFLMSGMILQPIEPFSAGTMLWDHIAEI